MLRLNDLIKRQEEEKRKRGISTMDEAVGEIKPKTTDYRLSPDQLACLDSISVAGKDLEKLVEKVSFSYHTNEMWLELGKTELQKGLMFLSRAVIDPKTF